MQLLEGPVGAHAGGVAIDTKFAGDFRVGFVLVESKEDEGALVFGELINGAIDFGRKLIPGFGGGFHGIEIGGGLFAFLASDFGANVID